MNIFTAIYNKLEEVYGAEVAIRAICGGGCNTNKRNVSNRREKVN